jgi:fluoride ion exporter CrcB/FEX
MSYNHQNSGSNDGLDGGAPTTPYQAQRDGGSRDQDTSYAPPWATPQQQRQTTLELSSSYKTMATPENINSTISNAATTPSSSFQPRYTSHHPEAGNVPTASAEDGVPASPYQAMPAPSMNLTSESSDGENKETDIKFNFSRVRALKRQDTIQFEAYDELRDRSNTADFNTKAAKALEATYGVDGQGIEVGSVSGGSLRSQGTLSLTLESSKQALLSKLQHEIRFATAQTVEHNEKSFNYKKAVVTLYMGCWAIIGCLMRICIAQYFGEECKNPGTVGWLAASSPLCITANGQATQSGGIVFADLPANMMGSFIMGFFQTCAVLKLTTHSKPLAWLSSESPFQSWDIMILAFRTGFCGSLTTFSSWNSEMVVMMYGTGAGDMNQWIQALFGYIIGLETAFGSYVFGKKLAVCLHRWINPILKGEADQLQDCGNGVLGHSSSTPGVIPHRHVHLNTKIPDFERRFLIGCVEEEELSSGEFDPKMLLYLEQWRVSTYDQRSDVYLASEALIALHEIERVLLVLHQEPCDAHREIASEYEWDMKSLKVWTKSRIDESQAVAMSMWHQDQCILFRLPVAMTIFLLLFVAPLIAGVVMADIESAYGFTYRTMWMSALWAPVGALVRWKLSKLNGTLTGEWKWLPLGTITANFIGCFVSISAIAIEFRLLNNNEYWRGCFLRATKIGFAGCLTTVSTFISEVDTLNQGFPRFHWDWQYIWLSLGGCFTLSMTTYGVIAYVIP